MDIALISKPGHASTGVGRYTIELERHLRAEGHQVTVIHPLVPLPAWLVRLIRRFGWDLNAFFNNYPIWASYPPADIYHITSQNLATLMLIRRPPGKTVITVHDIIPWLLRHDAQERVYHHRIDEWFDKLSLRGIQKADAIVTPSAFTAQTLSDEMSIDAHKLTL